MSQKRLVLLYGDPDHGKSYLSCQLRDEEGFQRINTDKVYVDWIRNKYPDFFFPRLGQFIAPHWNEIIRAGMRVKRIMENMVDAWKEHLFDISKVELEQHSKVVVEGYLVYWAYKRIRNLQNDTTDVLIVKAKKRHYFNENGKKMSLNEIAGP